MRDSIALRSEVRLEAEFVPMSASMRPLAAMTVTPLPK